MIGSLRIGDGILLAALMSIYACSTRSPARNQRIARGALASASRCEQARSGYWVRLVHLRGKPRGLCSAESDGIGPVARKSLLKSSPIFEILSLDRIVKWKRAIGQAGVRFTIQHDFERARCGKGVEQHSAKIGSEETIGLPQRGTARKGAPWIWGTISWRNGRAIALQWGGGRGFALPVREVQLQVLSGLKTAFLRLYRVEPIPDWEPDNRDCN
jgi:hypothetical protein